MAKELSSFEGKIYQLKIHILDVSPMVWRRLLVRDDTNIAQLHGIIQLLMGWENAHLHCFVIYGKEYGISYSGGMGFSDDPQKILLRDFQFRPKDKFRYDYNFHVDWKVQIRVEKIIAPVIGKNYPYCVAGNNAAPPETTFGIDAFTQIRELFRVPSYDLFQIIDFQECLGYPWRPDVFNKKKMNEWLRKGDDADRLYNRWSPHPPHPYFEEEYWFKKDELESLKWMWRLLKKEGILFDDDATGLDVYLKFLEALIHQDKLPSNPNSSPVDEFPQNS